jgi:hypothetical protein
LHLTIFLVVHRYTVIITYYHILSHIIAI